MRLAPLSGWQSAHQRGKSLVHTPRSLPDIRQTRAGYDHPRVRPAKRSYSAWVIGFRNSKHAFMFPQKYRLTVSTGCSAGLHWRPLTERIGILIWRADGIAAALR